MNNKLVILPYQRKYLSYNGSLIVCKSRQVGYTTMAALKSVLRSCNNKILDTIYTATNESLAVEFIRLCKNFANEFNIELKADSSSTLLFPNGSKIMGISSNPNSLHGRTNCTVILDEFSRHDNAKELLIAAEPITTWGNNIEILSTVTNPLHLFYQKYIDSVAEKTMYKAFKTDIYQAVNDGIAIEIYKKNNNGKMPENIEKCNNDWLNEQRDKVSSFVWTQQYECLPADGSSYLVPMKLYKELSKNIASKTIPDGLNDLYAGMDIGVTKNYTCLWVIKRDKDNNKNKYKTICVKWLHNVGIMEQIKLFKELIKGKNIKKIAIDQGCQGHTVVAELKKEFGTMIQGFSFNRKTKEETAELVRKICEDKRIELPSDEEIMNDICSMSVKESSDGNVKYDGGSKLDSENHADCFWALALALYLGEKNKPLEFRF